MRATKYIIALLALSAAYVGLQTAGAAENDQSSDEARCLNLRQIDHTRIVDDHTVLFYMKDKTVWLNRLPYSCPGLREGDPFMYRVFMDQLCQSDNITVLQRVGSGFIEGATCRLNPYSPITQSAADDLISNAAKDRSSK